MKGKPRRTPSLARVPTADRPKLRAAAKRAFLDVFAQFGNVTFAAECAGVHPTTAHTWHREDPEFALAWDAALDSAIDRLEKEARRRAEEGYEEPLVSGGRLIHDDDGRPLSRKIYSDALMQLLLKAHRPEKFQDRQRTEMVGRGGGPIEVTLDIAEDDGDRP